MNKIDFITSRISGAHSDSSMHSPVQSRTEQEPTLRSAVDNALGRYFQHIENEPVTDLHQLVMSEVEAPLLQAVMRYVGNNQSKASIMLGLNRGTLRTKLKQYGLL
ncbi:MAG: DNA-binding transcriptional regulator Fis [SAR86 cluster bacterium]|uniref:Putative Fis-like DNA-binding protein n=1 Tax=SAR86 cluster bacterium TaxID=2030880 RepID=A0A2A5AX12_9GAMM|nr:MAG: DNA-binding transcriptional regulator Fis [SAR86 cluster bacterium]